MSRVLEVQILAERRRKPQMFQKNAANRRISQQLSVRVQCDTRKCSCSTHWSATGVWRFKLPSTPLAGGSATPPLPKSQDSCYRGGSGMELFVAFVRQLEWGGVSEGGPLAIVESSSNPTSE